MQSSRDGDKDVDADVEADGDIACVLCTYASILLRMGSRLKDAGDCTPCGESRKLASAVEVDDGDDDDDGDCGAA
jgi:hypothetical protein